MAQLGFGVTLTLTTGPGSREGEKFIKQKLFIGGGLVKEILFLAQLGIGVTPYPDYRAR